ncbi:MAG: hypothetical protein ACOYK6_03735 [Chthoniobacterales bacterium]
MQTPSDFQYKIQQSRSHITQEYALLKDALNLSKRLEHSIQRKPWSWISGLFFIGVGLPWFLKKSIPLVSQKSDPSPISLVEEEKKTFSFSKVALLAASLLQDKTVRSGLFSTARFLFPLAQEAVANYGARKQNEAKHAPAEHPVPVQQTGTVEVKS